MSLVTEQILWIEQIAKRPTFDPNYEQDYPGPSGDFTGPRGWVFGAGDPEADAGADKAYRMGEPYVYSRNADGSRVSPAESQAYAAVYDPRVERFGRVITFETKMIGLQPDRAADHHGNRAPEGLDMSWQNAENASALAQMNDEMGEEPTIYEGYIGTLDHCALRVLHGELKSRDPKVARAVMVREIVKGQSHELNPSLEAMKEVDQEIEEFTAQILLHAKTREIGDLVVKDMLDHDLGVGYSRESLALKCAASICGYAVLVNCRDSRPGHPGREALTGYVTPKHVQAFGKIWVPNQQLERAVMDENRGVAMGYKPGELARIAFTNSGQPLNS